MPWTIKPTKISKDVSRVKNVTNYILRGKIYQIHIAHISQDEAKTSTYRKK